MKSRQNPITAVTLLNRLVLYAYHNPSPSLISISCSVCPYTIISFILSSFMIECRDLALNHLLKVGGSWDSFEPNGTGLTS
ncbi:MAG: hypothetical protein RXS23_08875, partial [Metallosphaera yellowstonensis]